MEHIKYYNFPEKISEDIKKALYKLIMARFMGKMKN